MVILSFNGCIPCTCFPTRALVMSSLQEQHWAVRPLWHGGHNCRITWCTLALKDFFPMHNHYKRGGCKTMNISVTKKTQMAQCSSKMWSIQSTEIWKVSKSRICNSSNAICVFREPTGSQSAQPACAFLLWQDLLSLCSSPYVLIDFNVTVPAFQEQVPWH